MRVLEEIFSHVSRAGVGRTALLAATALASPALAQSNDDSGMEIVVTAQKRTERIQDVPLSITAITADALDKRGYDRMGDYLLAQPSVVIQDRGVGRNSIVIRGVSAPGSNDNPTVAFYIGETPVTNGLGFGANGFPDLRTFDVERVEVLRGPQGTLYGAGSMGGTVKIVPVPAQLGEWQAQGEATLATTRHGGTTYSIAGAVNVPLATSLAARVVGYHYRDGGFIDSTFAGTPDPSLPVAGLGGASWSDVGVSAFGVPARNKDNVNSTTIDGVRSIVVFQPSGEFKLQVGALYQKAVADGLPENLPTLGDFRQSRMTTERLKDAFQLYDATMTIDLGVATVTSATAFLKREQVQVRDASAFFLNAPVLIADDNKSDVFSQELRIATDPEKPVSFLAGGFYTHGRSTGLQDIGWLGTSQSRSEFSELLTGAPLAANDVFYRFDEHNKAEQLAAFGQVSVSPVERVKLTGGVRVAQFSRVTTALNEGSLNGGTSVDISRAKETTTTPNFQIEFKPDRDSMYYARAAKGFRLGVPNQSVPSTCNADLAAIGLTEAPTAVGSDTLWNYEAGMKHTFAGGKAMVNVSAFYIDWKNLQTGFALPTCGFSFSSNAGSATTKGVEFDFTVRPAQNLTLNGSASYIDAKLEEDSPPATGVGGRKGDRLPGIPRWTLQGGVQYEFEIGDRKSFARVDARYLSSYFNRFPGATDGAQPAGDFAVVDARFGVDLTDYVQLEVYGSNLLDTKQLLTVDTELPDNRQILGRPRTFGATIRAKY